MVSPEPHGKIYSPAAKKNRVAIEALPGLQDAYRGADKRRKYE
jgi:hypothetical protein